MERLFVLLVFCVSLSACNSLERTNPMIQASAVNITKEKGSPYPMKTEELNGIKQTISEHFKEIEEQHSIKILMVGVGQDHIIIEIRRSGDVEQTLSEAEIEAFKRTVFGLVGIEFPIKLSVQACCTNEAGITGKIRAFDKEQKRILIVNEQKKNGNSDDPEATWVTLTGDGILVISGSNVFSGFDKSIIGREAKAWSTGVMLQSYPGQTSAVKVVVE